MIKKSICFLAPANNYHTLKWCKWFCENGYSVHVVSFTDGRIENAELHIIGTGMNGTESDLKKLKYFTYIRKVKKIIEEINPDIISVHFASSYGIVAALARISPYTLSVWGSDIFAFPNKGVFHKLLLKLSLRKATRILATSDVLTRETEKYTKKPVETTPWGVDTLLFHPTDPHKDTGKFVVGTIKALTPVYGIDYLIKAVAIIVKEHPEIPIELHIAGRGKNENEYKMLSESLNLGEKIRWLGFLSQEEVAVEWSLMDIAVLYSGREAFGISAIEAQACGIPLIISDAPGLLESTKPGESSAVVPFGDERNLAHTIVELYHNNEKRKKMGIAGREYAVQKYDIHQCFLKIEKILSDVRR